MLLNKLKTFAIHTLGCKVNIYDSNIIRNELLSYGLIEVDFNTCADLYIINTCSVTNQADLKSRTIINKAYRQNPNAIILVCGCYSQVEQNIEHASIVIGNKYKNNIIQILEEYLQNNTKLIKVDNLLLETKFEDSKISDFKEHTRAFIKIQEGCNFMCSYCIIPFTRGRQRSKPFNEILDEINKLVQEGYKEIVLTGVNTAGYQDGIKSFYDLLVEINKLDGDFRVRISSVEPFQIDNKIIDLIANNNRFCQHWHICLQSGSNDVLKRMNRKYTTEEFKKLVDYIYFKNPLTCITTDYICGFPTETDLDHRRSLEFCKQIKFYKLHVFPYSKRKFTPASLLEQVDGNIKKARVHDFLELNKELEKQFIDQFLNKEVEVIFEQKINTDQFIGKTSQYFEVVVKSQANLINKKCKVKITKIINNIVKGELI